jgi:NADH-quinone oxidoreductase subunit G
VGLICDIDETATGKTVGYNEYGDFIIGDNEKANLAIPALNQQEGTVVSIDKKVLNTNVALDFDGYCLNDLANKILPNVSEYTISYTPQLPASKGFLDIEFDDMQNGYDKYGKDLRGYMLKLTQQNIEDIDPDEIEEIDTFNGVVIYRCEPLHQFNKNTAKSLLLQTNNSLRGSANFALSAKIKDNDKIKIIYEGQELVKKFKMDRTIKGTIALCPTFDDEFANNAISSKYRFKQVKIIKVEE